MSDIISIDYTHHDSLTTDLISRQDAIECCSCLHPEDCWAEIKALPSATSKNLKKPNKTYEYDLISRADAIEAIDTLPTKYTPIEFYEVYRMAINDAEWTIEALPSAEPVQGEWIPIEEVWANVQPLKDKILDLEEKLYLQKDRQNGEWIPCSERMPSKSGRYLVTYLVLQRHIWVDVMHFGKPSQPNTKVKGKCWYVADDEWGDVVYDDILAWMPLPPVYQGE